LMTGTTEVLLLSAQYITDHKVIQWPPGFVESSVEGPGLLRSITGTDPAAGSEITETVPTNARWRLRGIRFELATSADVADRRVLLIIDDGASVFTAIVVEAIQTADLTRAYNFYSIAPRESVFTVGNIESPLPEDLMLLQGWRIRTSTVNLQAADDYGAPQRLVDEWIEK